MWGKVTDEMNSKFTLGNYSMNPENKILNILILVFMNFNTLKCRFEIVKKKMLMLINMTVVKTKE